MKNLVISSAVAALFLSASSLAFAQSQAPHLNLAYVGTKQAPQKKSTATWYIGAEAGYVWQHYTKGWLTSHTSGTAISSVGSVKQDGFAMRGFAGYDFSRYCGLEMGYLYTRQDVDFKNVVMGGTTFKREGFNQRAVDLLAVGRYPFGKTGLGASLKAGGAWVMRDNVKFRSSGGSVTTGDYTNDRPTFVLGAGLNYDFTNSLAGTFSYLHYFGRSSLKAIDLASLGLTYKLSKWF